MTVNKCQQLLIVGALLAFSTQAGAQVLAVNPFRTDNLFAPGSSAVIRSLAPAGEAYQFAPAPVEAECYDPLSTTVADISITVDGVDAGIWFVFADAINFVIPASLRVSGQRQSEVRVTTIHGVDSTMITLASSAPGFVLSDGTSLAGVWQAQYEGLFGFIGLQAIQITARGTVVALIVSGLPLKPPRRGSEYYVVVGSRRIPLNVVDFGFPGLEYAWFIVPGDLAAGRHQIQLESGRTASEAGWSLEFVQ